MSLADLRRSALVGEWPDRPTAAQFRTEVYRIDAVIRAIASDIVRNVALLSAEERGAWTTFVLRWGAFYNDYKDVGTLGNFFFDPDAYDQAFDFEREARTYRGLITSHGGTLVTPTPAPSSQEPTRGGNSLLWGALIVGGLFGVGYLVKTVKG